MRNRFGGITPPRVTPAFQRGMGQIAQIVAAAEEPQTYLDMGRQLVNSGLYDWALGALPRHGIPAVEDRHAAAMAMIIHQQMLRAAPAHEAAAFGLPHLATEDIQTTDLSLPTKWALPLIRRIYPAIFDSPLFATQTMPGPLAYAFYMDFLRESDGTDFRAVNPFTAFIAAPVAIGANQITVKMSGNLGAIGLGIYQVVAGQKATLSAGGAQSEVLTVQSVAVAANTATVTFTSNTTKTHATGDVLFISAVGSLGEAAVPTKAKLSLTRVSVSALKHTLAATWSTEAMEDARAQLNLDIEAEMVQGIAAEIGREIFGIIINDIVTGATAGNTTLPAQGAANVQDYRYLETRPLFAAEAGIYARRNHDADTILAGVDIALMLTEQDNFHITPADQYSTLAQFGMTYLGVFQGKFNVFKTQFLPPNTGIMFCQPKDWLHAGYVFMPYIPLSPMPLVYAGYNSASGNYQNTDEWTRNMRMRYGRLLTVSDEYALLTQN